MNISGISSSMSTNNINNSKHAQRPDAISSATRKTSIQKPDAISSATKQTGGDHYFESKA